MSGCEETENELAGVEKELRHRFVDLRRIFQFYAASDAGGAFDMSMAEFSMFCQDCRFAGTGQSKTGTTKIPKHLYGEIFSECGSEQHGRDAEDGDDEAENENEDDNESVNENEEGDGDDDDEDDNTDEEDDGEASNDGDDGGGADEDVRFDLDDGELEVGPEGFVEMILKVALRKFPGVMPISERVRLLFDDYIIPYACQSNTETFRGEIAMEKVQNVLKTNSRMLKKCFLHVLEKLMWQAQMPGFRSVQHYKCVLTISPFRAFPPGITPRSTKSLQPNRGAAWSR